MTKSKTAARQAAKKPSRRSQLKKASAKRAMPLRTRDPVRTVQMKSHENGAKPTKTKRPEADGREGSTANNSTANNNVTPSSGLFTLLMQWTPIGIFLRQQAVLANAMGQVAPTSRR
jgi:hypothetical protein